MIIYKTLSFGLYQPRCTSTPKKPMPGAVTVTVEELPFFRARVGLLQPQTDLISRKRAGDRTVEIVRRYAILSENLPMVKSQTMSCLEAIEGKGGAVSLRICNRGKFDAIKQSVREMEEEQSRLEQAVRALQDLIGPADFLDEMLSRRDSLSSVEGQQRAMLSTWASAAIQKSSNKRKSAEEALAGDEIYQSKKTQAEGQIQRAKAALEPLIPQIERIETILSGAGC